MNIEVSGLSFLGVLSAWLDLIGFNHIGSAAFCGKWFTIKSNYKDMQIQLQLLQVIIHQNSAIMNDKWTIESKIVGCLLFSLCIGTICLRQ